MRSEHNGSNGLVFRPCRTAPVSRTLKSSEGGPMTKMKEAAAEFLAQRRIAVTGVSRTPASHGANVVYRRLRERGYQVFAVNPNASTVEGDNCFSSLSDIPSGVDAVVIATRPDRADDTMRECHRLGIKHVWMHRGPAQGSVSPTATAYGRTNGIRVIDGGCPLMFEPTADGGHKVLRTVLTATGRVPRSVE
jgi:predicted CoA-binding protein